MLAAAVQSMPGSPEIVPRMMPFFASMAKPGLESVRVPADPKHVQARQAALSALAHQPGSREFFQALHSAATLGSEDPSGFSRVRSFMKAGSLC